MAPCNRLPVWLWALTAIAAGRLKISCRAVAHGTAASAPQDTSQNFLNAALSDISPEHGAVCVGLDEVPKQCYRVNSVRPICEQRGHSYERHEIMCEGKLVTWTEQAAFIVSLVEGRQRVLVPGAWPGRAAACNSDPARVAAVICDTCMARSTARDRASSLTSRSSTMPSDHHTGLLLT